MKEVYRYKYDRKAWRQVVEGVECRFWLSACLDCNGVAQGHVLPSARCNRCRTKRQEEINRFTGRAHARVQLAIKAGELPKLDGSVHCVDCGKVARVYDHREYAKPLQVDPVCYSCNTLRGPAIDAPFAREKDELKARA